MLVFVCHRHILYDLFDIFISSFYNAIHLCPVRGRVMPDLELRAELDDHSIIEIGTIICDDSFWNTITTNNVVSYESGHDVLGNRSK